jgi:putative addiction module component (TIGR02574 family)
LFAGRIEPRDLRHGARVFSEAEVGSQLEIAAEPTDTTAMTAASKQIESEVLAWAPAERVDFAERLLASVDEFATPEIESAWNKEIAGRVLEIREGRAEEISAEQVMAEARQKLHEARRLSSPRRRRAR